MNFFCIINANLVHPRCKRGREGVILPTENINPSDQSY